MDNWIRILRLGKVRILFGESVGLQNEKRYPSEIHLVVPVIWVCFLRISDFNILLISYFLRQKHHAD